MVAARAGSKLIKSGIKGAKRYWDDVTGKPKKVRAAKGSVGQPSGVGTSAKDRKKGAAHQNQPKAKAARKVEMHNLTDVKQPAGGSAGRTIDEADAGVANYKTTARTANQWDKALAKKEKALETYQKKRDGLKGKDKLKFINKNIQKVKDLKASIADMKKRGGPRVNKRKVGGQVMKKAGGGKMSHVGLYPAEESRSGTMSEKKRAKNMKSGGKVKKYGHGGQVKHNTSRENRLEELGRVDAEKAYTKKGKSNLRSEKKRIVKELNGNDFVARHYD